MQFNHAQKRPLSKNFFPVPPASIEPTSFYLQSDSSRRIQLNLAQIMFWGEIVTAASKSWLFIKFWINQLKLKQIPKHIHKNKQKLGKAASIFHLTLYSLQTIKDSTIYSSKENPIQNFNDLIFYNISFVLQMKIVTISCYLQWCSWIQRCVYLFEE